MLLTKRKTIVPEFVQRCTDSNSIATYLENNWKIIELHSVGRSQQFQ